MARPTARPVAGGAERLLSAASRLFATAGFEGVSVRELARAAGVTRPVLYYHFGSKVGLYRAAVRKAAADYDAALARASGGAGPVSGRIRRVCRAHAAARRRRALLAAPLGAPVRSSVARVVECVRGLVAEGIARGEIGACDAKDAALALVGVAEATAANVPRRDRLEGVLSVVLRGLAPAPGHSRSGAAAHRGRR